MHARAFLDRLSAEDPDRLVHVQELPARAPTPAPFPADMPELLVSRLGLLGITGLYPHQLEGLAALGEGHAMLATGTASGKRVITSPTAVAGKV